MSMLLWTIPVWAWASLAFAGDPPPPVKSAPKKAPGHLARDLSGPIALHADGKPIDVDVGHAAPCVADFLGDGTLHLLVGQFGGGKLRIYRNEGTKAEPRFAAFTWFDGKVPFG